MEETKEYRYKVSVVTAVYNVEDYLTEMIDSIIAQNIGFENVQLILVNDGSQDSSGAICDQYAAQYPDNIVVVHKENGGVSSARNEGLKYAEGAYVNFTDADDILEFNTLEVMYNYLEENEKWIDLVAVKLKFFGVKNGDHTLNYRFGKKSRIVDLRQEYRSIQLSISGTLVKKECFRNRKFDGQLAYAEDAQLVIDILMDKMQYGLVRGASYRYRKRDTGNSAVDLGRKKPSYYIPYLQRFTLYSLENAMKRKGYIPRFVQYTCMYDLQWRFNQYPLVEPNVLLLEEVEEYKALLRKALQYIDDEIILEQKNIGNNYKMAILSMKEINQNRKEIAFYPNDARIFINEIPSAAASSYTMSFEFAELLPEEVIIEGHIRFFVEFEQIEFILKAWNEEEIFAEYQAAYFDREEKCTFCMDEVITQAKGFQFRIARSDLPEDLELELYIRYQGNDILCKNISLGKFFPVSKKMRKCYLYQNDMILRYSKGRLKLSKAENQNVVKKYEKEFLKEILSKNNKMFDRVWIARKLYQTLKPLKKKELWLISDRIKKADDNGEAFFTYMNTIGKNEHIDTYFVLDKDSEDYERLCKIGKVVPYHSTKHKILSLLCDKVVSAQADDYVFNRFFNMSYLYKDILHRQKFIFLQHGVIKDDLSRWLARANKNISIFVTTTRMEYQSILDGAYHYDERQVKCTGLPRYDYLYDNCADKNIITFMPTWRSYLAGNFDVLKDSRALKSGFENSSYCKMYREVFADNRLYQAAEKYHYQIRLMLHPTMPHECIEYFDCNDCIEILDRNTRYRDLFADSKLIVTDYSSTVFDFAYLRKPVLYYQQDAEEFFSGKHTYDKGYFDYERDGFGEVEYTAESLINKIIEYIENGCQLKKVYRDRIEKTFPYNDRENCRRVYEEIIKLS